MMNGWEMTGWGWAWMSVWMITGIVVIAVLIALVARGSSSQLRHSTNQEAFEILRQRFAKGEIDEAEYERRRTLLEG